MTIRTYSELIRLPTIEKRFEYLALGGSVGDSTFGFERYLNQQFYRSRQWRLVREHVMIRDNGSDLGVEAFPIRDNLVIHHMNPMTAEDIAEGNPDILDPEFLITTTPKTHNAIHYGDQRALPKPFVARKPGDTKLW